MGAGCFAAECDLFLFRFPPGISGDRLGEPRAGMRETLGASPRGALFSFVRYSCRSSRSNRRTEMRAASQVLRT